MSIPVDSFVLIPYGPDKGRLGLVEDALDRSGPEEPASYRLRILGSDPQRRRFEKAILQRYERPIHVRYMADSQVILYETEEHTEIGRFGSSTPSDTADSLLTKAGYKFDSYWDKWNFVSEEEGE